jgi:hypothetical protein
VFQLLSTGPGQQPGRQAPRIPRSLPAHRGRDFLQRGADVSSAALVRFSNGNRLHLRAVGLSMSQTNQGQLLSRNTDFPFLEALFAPQPSLQLILKGPAGIPNLRDVLIIEAPKPAAVLPGAAGPRLCPHGDP